MFQRIKKSIASGLSFGLGSGIITTLGLIVGLHSGTHSKPVIIGAILTIAIADSFSDSLGIHIAKESEPGFSPYEVWGASLSALGAKFVFALTFLLPIIFLPLFWAIVVSIGWGFFLLGLFSFYLAKQQKRNPWPIIGEHLMIASLVLIITHFIGDFIDKF